MINFIKPARLVAALPLISLITACSSVSVNESDRVEIRWTEKDVPHIKADSFSSLGFGYGYVLAQDRLCEASGQAITLRGQRSRYYGADDVSTIGFLKTTNLNSDLAVKLRLPEEWIHKETNQLQPETREYIHGVARGMNAYVDQLSEDGRKRICANEPVPVFEAADIVRSVMRFGVMKELVDVGPSLVSSASAWDSTDNAFSENTVHSQPVEIEGGFGSNAWAYGGKVTSGGGAMLLGNPHSAWKRRPHMQRIYMHQAHLTIPGELDVAGAGFLGVPMPLTGYNENVAWTILDAATVSPFVLQALDVTESVTEPTYRMDEINRPLKIKTINVDILNEQGDVVNRKFKFAFSELGLVYKLPEKEGRPAGWYAITNAGEQNASGLDQFMNIARAKNTSDLIKAVEENRGILAQLLVADRHGDVGYIVAGNMLPITDEQKQACRIRDGLKRNPKIVDGTRRECAFRDDTGKPLKAEPSFFPTLKTRGILQNTNNSYKYTEYNKVQPDYPAVFGTHFTQALPGQKLAAGLRYDPRLIMSARRMKEITQDGVVTPTEALDVVFDNRNYAAETFLDDILAVCNEQDSIEVKTACKTLTNWDRKNNSDSRGALLFNQLWNRVVGMRSFIPGNPNGDPYINEKLVLNDTNRPQLINALASSVRDLNTLGFSADTTWGNALFAEAEGTRIGLHGGSYQEGILNGEMPAPLAKGGFPYILFGTAYLQRIRWENSELISDVLLSHGQREDVDSSARTEQLKMFSQKQLYRLPFNEEDLSKANIIRTLNLEP